MIVFHVAYGYWRSSSCNNVDSQSWSYLYQWSIGAFRDRYISTTLHLDLWKCHQLWCILLQCYKRLVSWIFWILCILASTRGYFPCHTWWKCNKYSHILPTLVYSVLLLHAGSLTKLSSLTFLTPMFASIFGYSPFYLSLLLSVIYFCMPSFYAIIVDHTCRYIFLHETFSPLQLGGAFITLIAIYMINNQNSLEWSLCWVWHAQHVKYVKPVFIA